MEISIYLILHYYVLLKMDDDFETLYKSPGGIHINNYVGLCMSQNEELTSILGKQEKLIWLLQK